MASNSLTPLKLPTPASAANSKPITEQFLQLHFASEVNALLPTERLIEVIVVSPESITPMPHMSPWLMGVHNWRSKILWLVDLGQLGGFRPLYRQVPSTSIHTVAVLQLSSFNSAGDDSGNDGAIGLVVDGVGNIEQCDRDSFQTSSCSATDNKLEKFLRGYWLKSEREILAVLDLHAIWQEIAPTSG